jgi:sugar phosphate isomerase/epimerase
MVGYTGVLSYEHEDVTMSRMDGVEKAAAYLKPLLVKNPYEGRKDKLFDHT